MEKLRKTLIMSTSLGPSKALGKALTEKNIANRKQMDPNAQRDILVLWDPLANSLHQETDQLLLMYLQRYCDRVVHVTEVLWLGYGYILHRDTMAEPCLYIHRDTVAESCIYIYRDSVTETCYCEKDAVIYIQR